MPSLRFARVFFVLPCGEIRQDADVQRGTCGGGGTVGQRDSKGSRGAREDKNPQLSRDCVTRSWALLRYRDAGPGQMSPSSSVAFSQIAKMS